MSRLILGLVCLALAAPAAAEDWWMMDTMGAAPTREVAMFDADSIDRTDAALPKITMGLISEQPDEAGFSGSFVVYAIDCKAAALKPIFVDIRDSDGKVLDSSPVTDEPFEPIDAGSNFELLRLAACDDRLQGGGAAPLGNGKTPTQLSKELFRN